MENLTLSTENQLANVATVAPKKEKKSVQPKEKKVDANVLTLDKLSALGITEKIKEKASNKSIFKKEFCNKADRSKCRDKFLNAIQLFLLFSAKQNKEKAAE